MTERDEGADQSESAVDPVALLEAAMAHRPPDVAAAHNAIAIAADRIVPAPDEAQLLEIARIGELAGVLAVDGMIGGQDSRIFGTNAIAFTALAAVHELIQPFKPLAEGSARMPASE